MPRADLRGLALLFALSACPAASESASATSERSTTSATATDAPAPAPPTPAPVQGVDGLREVALPAAPGSTSPSVTVGHDHRLYVVWLEPVGPEDYALRLARHGTEGWSDAHTVAEGENLFVNWADVPRVGTIPDGTVVVTWPQYFADGEGYGTRLARSGNGGQSFDAPIDLQGDARGSEFGFVSLVPEGDKSLRAYWLDARETAAGAPMQLWTAQIRRKGKPKQAAVVDPDVCDCCQTSVTASAVGSLVAYRDRTEDEIRDIRVAGGPLPVGGVPVHDDGWSIAGCPVNGPAIASHERELAVAWFSGQTPPGRVDVAFSADPNRFGSPIRVDGGKPLGRVDVQVLADGSALVTWMESLPDRPELAQTRVRRVHKDGRLGEPRKVAVTTGSREAGFPHSVIIEDRVLWVWTDPGHQGMSKVRAAEAPLSALQ